MSTLIIKVQPNKKQKKIIIEMDADKFERMAGDLGLFNQDFLESLSRSEHNYKAGRVREISSLKELRKK